MSTRRLLRGLVIWLVMCSALILAGCASEPTSTPRPPVTYGVGDIIPPRSATDAVTPLSPGQMTEPPPPATLEPVLSGHIADLVDQGAISLRAEGSGLETLFIDLKRELPETIEVLIPAGTFFVAASGSTQNMVVRRSETLMLFADQEGWVSFALSVACANMHLDEPGSEDTFTVLAGSHQRELEALAAVLSESAVDFDVEQAAIWIVTDDANYSDLGILVSGFGFGSRVIDETDTIRAMQLVEMAGIDISTRRIWADRTLLVGGTTDNQLLTWLGARETSGPPPTPRPIPTSPTGATNQPSGARMVSSITPRTVIMEGAGFIAVAFAPDGRSLATLACMSGEPDRCERGTIRVRDAETGNVTSTIATLENPHPALAYSPDGALLAAAVCLNALDHDCTQSEIRLWDAATGAQAGVLGGYTEEVDVLAFSPDGATLAGRTCVSRDAWLCTAQEIWLWDVAARQVRAKIGGFVHMFDTDLDFSPDGRRLVSPNCINPDEANLCTTWNILIWDTATGMLVRTLTPGFEWLYDVRFTADGSQLAVSGSITHNLDGLWVLDSSSGNVLAQQSFSDELLCWAFDVAPDGRTVSTALCAFDEEYTPAGLQINLWSSEGLEPLYSVDGAPLISADSLIFSPDGKKLAVLDMYTSGEISLWDTSP